MFARITRARGNRSSAAAATSQVTFNRDIAPIMFRSCATCHRPGEAGPFPLLTYSDAKKHARQIAEVTRSRAMPPWLPEPQELKFADELATDGIRDQIDRALGRAGNGRRRPSRPARAAEIRRGMAAGRTRPDSQRDEAPDSSAARNRHVLEFYFSGPHQADTMGESG